MVAHQLLQVHGVLVDDHTRDLGRELLAHHRDDRGVHGVADHLSALNGLRQEAEGNDVEGRQGHLDRLLGLGLRHWLGHWGRGSLRLGHVHGLMSLCLDWGHGLHGHLLLGLLGLLLAVSVLLLTTLAAVLVVVRLLLVTATLGAVAATVAAAASTLVASVIPALVVVIVVLVVALMLLLLVILLIELAVLLASARVVGSGVVLLLLLVVALVLTGHLA